MDYSDRYTNVSYVCENLNDGKVYVDDRDAQEMDFFAGKSS